MGPDRVDSPSTPLFPRGTPSCCPMTSQRTFAALVEPFAVGLHGVHTAELSCKANDVLVVGAGGVGLTTTAWARVKGAAAHHRRGSRSDGGEIRPWQ